MSPTCPGLALLKSHKSTGKLSAVVVLALALTPLMARGQATQPSLPLHVLAFDGDLAAVQARISKGDRLDATDRDGITALHWVARNWQRTGQIEMTNWLIEHGAPVQATDRIGRTPLHMAASGGNVLVLQALIRAGAPLDAVTIYGRTALHYSGNSDIVVALIDAGAFPNTADENGKTPIAGMVEYERWDMVEILARELRKRQVAATTNPAATQSR